MESRYWLTIQFTGPLAKLINTILDHSFAGRVGLSKDELDGYLYKVCDYLHQVGFECIEDNISNRYEWVMGGSKVIIESHIIG